LTGIKSSLPVITSIFNSLIVVAGAFIYTALFEQIANKPPSLLFKSIFFLTYLGIVLPISIGLMETPTAILLVGVAFLLLMNNNHWCLTIFGVLPFFRPEMIVVVILTGIYIVATKRFKVYESIMYFLVGALPFFVFDLFFFQTLIPNTIKVKSVVYSLTYIASIKYLITYFWGDLELLGNLIEFSMMDKIIYSGYALWVLASIILIYLYKIIYQISVKKDFKEKEWLGLLFFFWVVAIIFGYFYKRTLIFSWYSVLFLVPLLLIIGKTVVESQSRTLMIVFSIMLAPLFLGQFSRILQVSLGAFYDRSFTPDFVSSARVRNYIQTGKELYAQYPDARVMAAEIGGLGYGFEGYIYDGVGLVSPDAIKYHPLDVNAFGGIPSGFLREKQPELVVGYDVFLQDLLFGDTLKGYTQYQYPLLLSDDLAKVNSNEIFNSKALNVFVDNDLIP
jgi:hypothetical protein